MHVYPRFYHTSRRVIKKSTYLIWKKRKLYFCILYFCNFYLFYFFSGQKIIEFFILCIMVIYFIYSKQKTSLREDKGFLTFLVLDSNSAEVLQLFCSFTTFKFNNWCTWHRYLGCYLRVEVKFSYLQVQSSRFCDSKYSSNFFYYDKIKLDTLYLIFTCKWIWRFDWLRG